MKLPRPSTAGWLAIPGWRRASIACEMLRTIEQAKVIRLKSNAVHEAKAMLAVLLSVDPELPAEIEKWQALTRPPKPDRP